MDILNMQKYLEKLSLPEFLPLMRYCNDKKPCQNCTCYKKFGCTRELIAQEEKLL